MLSHSWKGVAFLSALFGMLACSKNGPSTPQIDTGSEPATVENSQVFGENRVHFNAFNSTFLSPKIAKLYSIRVNEKLGVCMVSINQKDTPGVGVEAAVNGTATNLSSQLRELEFNEVREGSAVYHICTFPFGQKENLTFNVDVEIAPTGEKYAVTWQQEFWRD